MNANLETLIIAVVGLGTLVWAVTAAYRSVKKVGGCSSCASSGDCPAVNSGGELLDLSELSTTTPQNTPCHSPPRS